MDTFKLKVFAITVMLIDHIGATLVSPYSNYWLYFTLRGIGRLAFPIFVFLIVEGFYHTRNIKKYLFRLGIFVFVSELPFDLAFYRFDFGRNVIQDIREMFNSTENVAAMLNRLNENQNVFFTLFLGLLLITLIDYIDKNIKLHIEDVLKHINKKYNKRFQYSDFIYLVVRDSLECALIIIICAAAYVLKTDYQISGILLVVAFYLFRGSIPLLALATFIITAFMQSDVINFFQTGNYYDIISILATFSIIPIALYNGKKGKSAKYFFYIFYPAHLFCLFLIQYLV